MTSMLGRLFGKARENFTTEALAAAIRSDPRPFLAALGEPTTTSAVTVETQVPIVGTTGKGFLDLVVEVGAHDSRRRFWFEVKIGAGEHGDQMANYLGAAATLPEVGRPKLFIIAPNRLRDDVPWLSWQNVRCAIMSSGSDSLYWADFRSYLEEIGMADTHSEPIAPSELTALGPAASLFGKVGRLLVPFATRAPTIWPSANWPMSEHEIRKELGKHFVWHGTLAMNSRSAFRAGVAAGVYHDDGTSDAQLAMWIWLPPRRLVERQQIWAQADRGGLDVSMWSRDAGWELLAAHRRLGDFKDAEEAAGWLLDRLGDLMRAGVLGVLPESGVNAAGEESDDAEERSDSDL